VAAELRSIARDDERASRDERRLHNRLRADLIATFPAALVIAEDDLGSPTFLRLIQTWPTAPALAAAGRDEIETLARAGHHGRPHRFVDRVAHPLNSSSHPNRSRPEQQPTPDPSSTPAARGAAPEASTCSARSAARTNDVDTDKRHRTISGGGGVDERCLIALPR
jgi:hypothetical protein